MGTSLDSVPISGIVRIRELMYALDRPFRLDQGDVSFDAPETMKAAMRAAIDANQTHYLQTAGLPRLKALLAEKLRAQNGMPVALRRRGAGDQRRRARDLPRRAGACRARRRGDRAGPRVAAGDARTCWRRAPRWCGARCTRRSAGASMSTRWRRASAPRTKGLYLNSPNNPTGGVFTRGDVERLADLARERDLWVISDEAYEDVLFDGAEHVSIASLPGMYERTVPVCTFSKTYAATGVRVGYLAARDERLRDRLQKLLFLTTSNVSSIVAVRGRRRAGRPAGRRRAVPGGAAGAAGPVLCRHSGGRRPRLQRRAARGRVLRVPAHRPVVDTARRRRVALHARGRWRSS